MPTSNQGNDRGSSTSSNRGFASTDEDKQREIAGKGGQSQGRQSNPGNFANDREKASEAGRKGGESRQGQSSSSSGSEEESGG